MWADILAEAAAEAFRRVNDDSFKGWAIAYGVESASRCARLTALTEVKVNFSQALGRSKCY